MHFFGPNGKCHTAQRDVNSRSRFWPCGKLILVGQNQKLSGFAQSVYPQTKNYSYVEGTIHQANFLTNQDVNPFGIVVSNTRKLPGLLTSLSVNSLLKKSMSGLEGFPSKFSFDQDSRAQQEQPEEFQAEEGHQCEDYQLFQNHASGKGVEKNEKLAVEYLTQGPPFINSHFLISFSC